MKGTWLPKDAGNQLNCFNQYIFIFGYPKRSGMRKNFSIYYSKYNQSKFWRVLSSVKTLICAFVQKNYWFGI